ncbi:MAG: hypothetical protein EXR45_07605 [Chloroflexi bacterium]|nr:hypothetical protein [Chloroflexota bacterium]
MTHPSSSLPPANLYQCAGRAHVLGGAHGGSHDWCCRDVPEGDEVPFVIKGEEARLPVSLATFLDAELGAHVTWHALSPSSRREYVLWIVDAERPGRVMPACWRRSS